MQSTGSYAGYPALRPTRPRPVAGAVCLILGGVFLSLVGGVIGISAATCESMGPGPAAGCPVGVGIALGDVAIGISAIAGAIVMLISPQEAPILGGMIAVAVVAFNALGFVLGNLFFLSLAFLSAVPTTLVLVGAMLAATRAPGPSPTGAGLAYPWPPPSTGFYPPPPAP